MKNIFSKLILLATILAPLSSWALFEARLTYGALNSTQAYSSVCQGSCASPTSAPGVAPTYGTGADAILKLPFIPVGLGVRYENMGLAASASAVDVDVKYSRTALLVNYRLIDTIVHFGPIASYGISHTGSMSIKEGGVTRVDLAPTTMSSYSVGLELEVKPLIVIPLVIGVEGGYMGFNWNGVTNSIDSTKKDVDLSGTYLKVFLGLDI